MKRLRTNDDSYRLDSMPSTRLHESSIAQHYCLYLFAGASRVAFDDREKNHHTQGSGWKSAEDSEDSASEPESSRHARSRADHARIQSMLQTSMLCRSRSILQTQCLGSTSFFILRFRVAPVESESTARAARPNDATALDMSSCHHVVVFRFSTCTLSTCTICFRRKTISGKLKSCHTICSQRSKTK